MVEPLIDQPKRYNLDAQAFGQRAVGFEAGAHAVAGPEQRLGPGLRPPQRVAFPFEGQVGIDIGDLEAGIRGPACVARRLGLALRHAECGRHEGSVEDKAAVGGETHVRQPCHRFDGRHVRVPVEDVDERVPLATSGA